MIGERCLLRKHGRHLRYQGHPLVLTSRRRAVSDPRTRRFIVHVCIIRYKENDVISKLKFRFKNVVFVYCFTVSGEIVTGAQFSGSVFCLCFA